MFAHTQHSVRLARRADLSAGAGHRFPAAAEARRPRARLLRQLAVVALVVGLLAAGAGSRGPTAFAAGSGGLYAWGSNSNGQLGNNSITDSHVPVQPATAFPAGTAITALAQEAGSDHSLALDGTGKVWAWGLNGHGQLGNNSTTDSHVPVQASLPAGTIITALAAGNGHSLALDSTGKVWVWGYNSNGQLGNNSTADSHVPVQASLPAGTVITALAAGSSHSLALDSTGKVWAWGYNSNGQLGNNSTTDSHVPVQASLPAGTIITTLAAGNFHSLALDSSGKVWAWGDNSRGPLGNTTTNDSQVPVQASLPAGTIITALAAGSSHSLALDSSGKVWAWGLNGNGELGNNSTIDSHVPVPVTSFPGMITAGSGHSLALDSTGALWAWGANTNGQLGNNSTTDSHVPLQVPAFLATGTGIGALAAGFGHSLALDGTGKVWAWGLNGHGQLGNNSTTDSHVPLQVPAFPPSGTVITAIAAGTDHSLALDSSGTVWAWGQNDSGQLGTNSTTESHVPVKVTGFPAGTIITAITAGYAHSLALDSSGKVWAWGLNAFGELGNNSTTDSHVPVQVTAFPAGTVLTALAAGDYHSLAVDSTGKLWAWGQNASCQLGTGNTTESNVPVQVTSFPGGTVITGLAASSLSSLALGSTGGVWAWGSNSNGQLGNNSNSSCSTLPVQVSFPGLSGVRIAAGGNESLALLASQPAVTTAPVNQTAVSGQRVSFTAAAAGTPPPGVHWQVSTDGGATFTTINGATTPTYTVTAGPSGNQYRAVFFNSAGTATTSAATLSVTPPTSAVLASPVPGTTLSGSSVTFSWSGASGAQQYVLWVGTAAGKSDLFWGSNGTGTSVTATGLPTNGSTLDVQLWTFFSSGWQSDGVHTYIAFTTPSPAALSTPAPGSLLGGSTVTFSWTGVTSAQQYVVWVGTAAGKSDLFWGSNGTATAVTATGLPTNGSTLDVQLWTLFASGWLSDGVHTYTASTALTASVLSTPAPGSTLSSSSTTFSWTGVSGADQYVLWVGTAAGKSDLFWGSNGTATSITATGLPTNGTTLYIQLWTHRPTPIWLSDGVHTYTAAALPASLATPAPGSTLSGSSVTFSWTGVPGAQQYVLWVGTAAGKYDLFWGSNGTGTSVTATGLPTNGSTLSIQLWTLFSSGWQSDGVHTYTAAQGPAVLTTPAPGTALTSSSATFSWTGVTGAQQYVVWVGTAAGKYDLFWGSNGTATAVIATGLPTNGSTLDVQLWTLFAAGWQSDGVHTYTAATQAPAGRTTTAPRSGLPAAPSTASAVGATVPGAPTIGTVTGGDAQVSVAFSPPTSDGGAAIRSYTVTAYVGGIATQLTGSAPGSPITVRGLSNGTAYTFAVHANNSTGSGTESDQSQSVTPSGGGNACSALGEPDTASAQLITCTLTDGRVTLSWNAAGTGSYHVWLGTAQRADDLADQTLTSTSFSMAGLPTSGTIYLRLSSTVGATHPYNDYGIGQ